MHTANSTIRSVGLLSSNYGGENFFEIFFYRISLDRLSSLRHRTSQGRHGWQGPQGLGPCLDLAE